MRHGSASALLHGPEETCQSWARAICDSATERGEVLDGILAESTMTKEPMPVLFSNARSALPPHPVFARALSSDALTVLLDEIARQINYALE